MIASTEGKIFVNGLLSTHDRGKEVRIICDVIGLSADKKFFVEFFQGTLGVSGTWQSEIRMEESGESTFYREVYIDNALYHIPDFALRLGSE